MWGTAAGSDGDSMPESPLSLDDGKLPPSIQITKLQNSSFRYKTLCNP